MARSFTRALWLCALLVLALGSALSRAQESPVRSQAFSQEMLDQLLAPIALYPDSLLTQVLIASTYPLEVVQAARFVDRNPDLRGDALAHAVEGKPWDPSVLALVQFPSVIMMMNDKLEWTQTLGDAFLSQQGDVMDTVQGLRARAHAAGNLSSNSQQSVVVQERIIVIEPAQPQVVFVPYFNPLIVYGTWWWPAFPPWYWVPPPRFRPPTWGQVAVTGIAWGVAIGITNSMWNGWGPNWNGRNITINNNVNNITIINNNRGSNVWTHNPNHRRGVAYRDPVTRDRFVSVNDAAAARREAYRGRDDRAAPVRPAPGRPSAVPAPEGPVTRPGSRPPPGEPVTRPTTRPAPSDPATRPNLRPAPGESTVRPAPDVPATRPGSRPSPAEPVTRPTTRPAPSDPAARPNLRPAPEESPIRPAPGGPSTRPALPQSRPQAEARPAQRPTPQPGALNPGISREAVQAQADRGRVSREAVTRPQQGSLQAPQQGGAAQGARNRPAGDGPGGRNPQNRP